MKLHFTKMQGCGNDYIYVDTIAREYVLKDKAELAQKISDRHFGIGSDGLILINRSKIADFEMEMYNADGSRGKMCGNGIRCVAKYVYDKGYVQKTDFTIECMGAVKKIRVFPEGGKVKTVTVDMGEPILQADRIPVAIPGDSEGRVIAHEIAAGNFHAKITCVSMGNPHAVLFSGEEGMTDFSLDHLDIDRIGPCFETHELFPERINTEFVTVLDEENVRMRVWERGSGETLACGTGCCATAVACILNNKTGRKVSVHVPGGTVDVLWDEKDSHIYMSGPAEIVFEGEIEI